ncbi:hypothetical protein ACIBI3_37730 [Actinomadura luteofluorescens]|uniref:VMAP-C domain-containing protein n=1 Tax=Actinomadura luteofluorescens TaxID=46163 RepID=UPI0034919FD7
MTVTEACLSCGKPLEQRDRGRPAQYCSDACRVRAYRTRSRRARPSAAALEIVEALADVRELQDASGRMTFIHAIGEVLGTPLLIQHHSSPKIILYNVVTACREHAGGMEALLLALDFLAGTTLAAARVRRLAWPETRHDDLSDVLTGLRMPELLRIYHTACGADPVAVDRPDDAWKAFSALPRMNTGDETVPPHLVFVELLLRAMRRRASEADGGADAWRVEKLVRWLDAQIAGGDRLGAGDLGWLRDQEAADPAPLEPCYLIMQLEPAGEAPDDQLIRLSHWRQIHPFEWRPQRGADRVLPLAQIPAAVRDLIQEAESGWAYHLDDPLVLEFVLPMDLLHLAPDQWSLDPQSEPYPTPLGCEYEVVVRSFERLRTLPLHRAWRRRWSTLALAGDALPAGLRIAGPTDLDRLRGMLMNDGNVVVYVLSSRPDREPGRTELRMALRAGVPVVLWNREDASPDELADVLGRIREEKDIRRLPAVVKQIRAQALLDDGRDRSLFSSMALLYDDPHHYLTETPSALEASPLNDPA